MNVLCHFSIRGLFLPARPWASSIYSGIRHSDGYAHGVAIHPRRTRSASPRARRDHSTTHQSKGDTAGATSHMTGNSCQPSRVDDPRSLPIHGEMRRDQRPSILASLHGQGTYGLHPSSMARRAVDQGSTHLPRRD
ncbi:hypothetical protein CDL15_Pgr027357 [Punica granatum]|uniref:Uncharacterized protein n=1 Tax=Punica granatum TaxID=22663 RepID=A0A218Y1B2_PUNGR|nr:hypothetical protein CDL15_Pgr027357 [Punica granatum]